jgi:hypothetical protein
MEKKKKQITLIIVLIPLMAFLVYNNLIVGPKKKKAQARARRAETKTQISQPAPVAAARKKQVAETKSELPPVDKKLVQIQNTVAEGEWGRDPFNPAPTPEIKDAGTWDLQNFRLSGVIPGPTGGAAIINGEVVGVGEYYRGFRLTRVKNLEITLEKDGNSYILNMPEE